MGNLFITPAIPAANGTGASISTSRLGLEKTISVDGVFSGVVTVEVSNGKGYMPIASFTAPGRQVVKLAAQDVRVVRKAATAVPGTPVVTIAGNQDGAQFAELAVGTPGASADLKNFGMQNTVVVGIDVGELTLTGQPLDTETVVIGDKTYTFQTVLTDVDGNVLIGASAAESLANLIAAINLGAGAGVSYADSMTANTDVAANEGSTTLIMEAKLLDSAGSLRGIATSDTLTNGSWGATTVGKQLDGVVQIQTSEDDAVWTDLCSFSSPGHKTVEITARYVRVNHVNNVLASVPSVAIGAVNDDTAHRPMLSLVETDGFTLDGSLSDSFEVTQALDTTWGNPINVAAGQVLDVSIIADGASTLLFGDSFLFVNGNATLDSNSGAGEMNYLRCFVAEVDSAGTAVRMYCSLTSPYIVQSLGS